MGIASLIITIPIFFVCVMMGVNVYRIGDGDFGDIFYGTLIILFGCVCVLASILNR